jgi:hypothetical protein
MHRSRGDWRRYDIMGSPISTCNHGVYQLENVEPRTRSFERSPVRIKSYITTIPLFIFSLSLSLFALPLHRSHLPTSGHVSDWISLTLAYYTLNNPSVTSLIISLSLLGPSSLPQWQVPTPKELPQTSLRAGNGVQKYGHALVTCSTVKRKGLFSD